MQYLRGQTQLVYFNGYELSHFPVTSGIPEGFVLCPLLFLHFINDISDNILSYTRTTLNYSEPFKLQEDVNESTQKNELAINKLDLNINKFYTLRIILKEINKTKTLLF